MQIYAKLRSYCINYILLKRLYCQKVHLLIKKILQIPENINPLKHENIKTSKYKNDEFIKNIKI